MKVYIKGIRIIYYWNLKIFLKIFLYESYLSSSKGNLWYENVSLFW